jgi:hypothetical protein
MNQKITEYKIKDIATAMATQIYHRLTVGTSHAAGLPNELALCIAKDTGDRLAQALDLSLREHDVEILR